MAELTLTKNRIKPGKTERLRDWTAEITRRRDEAIETLHHEGMHTEAAFIERTDGGDYLIYYMEAEDIDRVYEAFKSSPYEIDEEHRDVMNEVLSDEQAEQDFELLYHLVNPERP